jgi:hypothetical protein
VTGAHRSGTTWVGRILASAPSVAYIHEPFHVRHDPAVCGARFDHWFTYVCDQNETAYAGAIRDMLARASTNGQAGAPERSGVRPLIKDPIAVFSAAWLAARFQTRNVVMIRHPAAFAASLKAKAWAHPFAHFLEQPLLMSHHLEPFAGEIMRFTRQVHDIVDQAALLWRLIYSTVLTYQRRFPDWIFVRHEDLAANPLQGFRSLFDRLDLEYSDATEEAIVAEGSVDVSAWRTRLTAAEIERVRIGVGDLVRRFYTDDEWCGRPC